MQRGVSLLEQGEWGFVVENYKKFYRGNDYVTQMAALVTYNKENPDAAYGRLVRGYHYAFLGYKKPAQKQLAKAVELESRDRLAADLLVMVGGKVPTPSPTEEILPPSTTVPEIPAATARK